MHLKQNLMKQSAEIHKLNDEVIVTFLNLLLADEYVLYTKTRTAHWNVDGANLFEMHVFLENQYNELDLIIDDIADRIRSLGHFALGSLKDFLSITQMTDDNPHFNNLETVFAALLSDHQSISRIIQHEIYPISHSFEDLGTADFLTGIMARHQKMAWMLKSFLSGSQFRATVPAPININQLADWQD